MQSSCLPHQPRQSLSEQTPPDSNFRQKCTVAQSPISETQPHKINSSQPLLHTVGRPSPVVLCCGRAKARFDGSYFGDEYLNFERSVQLVRFQHPDEGEGWAYGGLKHVEQDCTIMGWFPTDYLEEEDSGGPCPSDAPLSVESKKNVKLEDCSSFATPVTTSVIDGHAVLCRGKAKANFDGTDFGVEYLAFHRNDKLLHLEHDEASDGWAYGQASGGPIGWFPLTFLEVDACLGDVPASTSPEENASWFI